MANIQRVDGTEPVVNTSTTRPVVVAVLVGGGLFVLVMLTLAGISVMFDLITKDQDGRWQIGRWLVLEAAGGAVASVLVGAICRRMARRNLGPVVLATALSGVALLEATELMRQVSAGRVVAPEWLILSTPAILATGVMLGGYRPDAGWKFDRGASTGLGLNFLRCSPLGLLILAATAVAVFFLPHRGGGVDATVVASALTLDFVVVGPALVYIQLVRTRRAPWFAVAPAVVVGYVLATVTIPEQTNALLPLARVLVVAVELFVVVYLAGLAFRGIARAGKYAGDFATRFRSAAREVLGSRIPADILATEIAILVYAFGWGRRPSHASCTFTVHREVGYLPIVVSFFMVILVEAVGVHLLLRQWSNTAAWVLTGLSIYACVWLLGDYRAMSARPIRVTATHLQLRVGVRWEADIPLQFITSVEAVAAHEKPTGSDAAGLFLLGQPKLRLRLCHSVEVTGMYGLRKVAREIWITADCAALLYEALTSRISTLHNCDTDCPLRTRPWHGSAAESVRL